MSNWWDAAPLAAEPVVTPPPGNWWEAAPLVEAPRRDDRPSMLGSAARGVARGVTFGFADELAGVAGGVGSLVSGDGFGPGYERFRDAARQQNRLDDQTNPLSAIAGQVVGGVATLPLNLVGRAAQGAGALAQVGNAALRGATSGAAGGALAGLGEGEGGLENRLGSAATGAAVGGVLGGALGAGVNVGAGVAGRVLDATGLRNAGLAADRQVVRALSRDGVDIRALTAPPVGHAADDLALVDRGGANLRNLGAVAANTPGAAQEAADRFVQARRGARPDRIAGAVDDTLGGGGGTRVLDDMDALRSMRTAEARPLYDAAFAAQAPDTPQIQQIMNLPIVQQAMRESLDLQSMAARGGDFQPSQMQMLDAAKRGLDERINATLDTVTGRVIQGRGAENIALTEVRDALVRELDAVPEYAAARAAWAGPTQTMDAMRVGQGALRLNPDALTDQVRRIGTPGNMDAARVGLGRAITDQTRDPANAISAARRLVEDRNHMRRLEALVPDNQQRNALIEALRRENAMGQVEQAVSPRAGSQTARLTAGAEDMGRDPPGGILASLLMGHMGSAVSQGVNHISRLSQGINSNTADQLARLLFETSQGQNAATVQRLLRQSQADNLTAQQRAALAAAITQSLGSSASMTVN
jgi:hypothetical protein